MASLVLHIDSLTGALTQGPVTAPDIGSGQIGSGLLGVGAVVSGDIASGQFAGDLFRNNPILPGPYFSALDGQLVAVVSGRFLLEALSGTNEQIVRVGVNLASGEAVAQSGWFLFAQWDPHSNPTDGAVNDPTWSFGFGRGNPGQQRPALTFPFTLHSGGLEMAGRISGYTYLAASGFGAADATIKRFQALVTSADGNGFFSAGWAGTAFTTNPSVNITVGTASGKSFVPNLLAATTTLVNGQLLRSGGAVGASGNVHIQAWG